MNRRSFLTAALATLAMPAVVQAFDGEPTELEAVAAAFRLAAETQRHLLVFVIPEENDAKWTRGRAFGELLNYGTDEAKASMGEAVLVAATLEQISAIVPSANSDKAQLFAIDATSIPAVAKPLHTALEPDPDWSKDMHWDERINATDRAITARIAALSSLVAAALPAPRDKGAALAHFQDVVLTNRIDGSHWARSGGCGTTVEGASSRMAVGCGMGHVNARSARVMYFFEVEV